MMDIVLGFSIGFFSIFGALFIATSASQLWRAWLPPASRWLSRHLLVPRLFRERQSVNPTRVELLCHLFHWTAVIVCNTCHVVDLNEAATRSGQLAVIHMVPLLIAYQLGFLSRLLGVSYNAIKTVHQSLAFMALMQSTLHVVLQLQINDTHIQSMMFQIIVSIHAASWKHRNTDIEQAAASLLALSILPLVRRYGYEMFLWLHRAISITLLIALWRHVRSTQTLNRILVQVMFSGLITSTLFQSLKQLYRNATWSRHGVRIIRTLTAQRYGDCVIVKIQLVRPWKFRSGQFIFLRLLTVKSASVFQSHPFVITWWDEHVAEKESKESTGQKEFHNTGCDRINGSTAQVIYVMIDPQRGWTRSITENISAFEDQMAWLDGPFGSPHQLQEYSTVLLFASGNGIFAQMPLLKDLTTGLKTSSIRTRRVKLVWEGRTSNPKLQEWMHEILRDTQLNNDVSVLNQPFNGNQTYHSGSGHLHSRANVR